MKDQYFTERGIAYRTNELVRGRPTLVFVHGVSGSSSAWKEYEEALKDEFNIVTYDQRGHGHSKRYSKYSDYHLKKFGEDLHELLTHIGEYPYILVGHSFGVLVVLSFLEHWQKQIAGVILISGDYYVGRHFAVRLLSFLLSPVPLLTYLPKFAHKPGRINYARFPNSGDWHMGRSLTDVRNTGVCTYLFCLKQSYVPDFSNVLESITVPTLVLHGTKDTIFNIKNSVAMAKRIPGATFKKIEGANHIVVVNFPHKVIDALRAFVKTTI